MIRFATLAAAAVMALAAPAAASAAPVPVQAATDPGVSVEAVRAWLTSKGGVVSTINRQDGETWISIADGPLTWVIFFYGCQADACGDIQYAASFSNANITQAMVNDWNRDRRFLKAYFLPGQGGEDPSAVVQYDVLMQGSDVEQLTDHTALWLDLVSVFGTAVGYFAAAG
ncbi:YbjN domain-containing protein [Roseibacterium beibuensis]|uniref:YbjN domain-containing protein n=1 Tax=[Roseibacterium] beibuensis TaxID=1193142 RepID=UPI00217DF515|nr:YbjN domain-containing protein [Roseibacterium beibuensis]MCS6626922.1 YbjN domain-containing protein [Roseibacterium beibuensis]